MTDTRPVRTRVAPSPTGDPHIGTAYQVLFNYAFAKSRGGQFLLRIEDTDQTRSSRESENAIFEALAWLGLPHDEGPDVGGPHGPYRQSERSEIYREHAQRLLDSGHAYYCFATREQLEQIRAERPDEALRSPDADLDPSEARRRAEAGEPHVIRLRTPAEGDCVFQDMLRGEIRQPWQSVDDQILMKSDGFPTYHLANVVDDHLMGISHVLRGEEWISSAPKHLLLYEAFGWQPPELCHLPLLRNPDKSKLSKRKNPVSILYYRAAGFLPEALVNFLGLIGYSMPDEVEMFGLEEMVASFDLKRVSLGGPVFDQEKLRWLNGRYLRERHDPAALLERLRQWKLNEATWLEVLGLAQKRIETLSDLVPLTEFFFRDMVDFDPAEMATKKTSVEELPRLVQILLWQLEGLRDWRAEAIRERVETVAEQENLKLKEIVRPLFVALSGSPVATPLFESMEILGGDLCRRRLHAALDRLAEAGHPLKGKALKRLEKDYAARYGG